VQSYLLDCPWCGAQTEVTADFSAGNQTFVQDCVVCCSPILVRATCSPLSGEMTELVAVREND